MESHSAVQKLSKKCSDNNTKDNFNIIITTTIIKKKKQPFEKVVCDSMGKNNADGLTR